MKKAISAIFLITLFANILFYQTSFAKTNYPDVKGDFWAVKEIDFLSSKGIIKGYANGYFGPNDHVKRSQAAVMISRALNLDLSNVKNPGFDDIPINHHAYKEIAAVVQEGIFPKERFFNPDQALKRADMARALVNAYDLKGSYGYIKDVPSNHWAYEYVQALASNEITNIYPDQTYKPNDSVNRAQFSVFFARVLDPSFRSSNTILTTRENIALNDGKVVTVYTNKAQGSGVLVAPGVILTNHHVVEDMEKAYVKFTNGTKINVLGVISYDAVKDLALIKLEKQTLITPVKMGDSNSTVKGDKVVAIGSPLGLENTASEGLVSSFRTIDGVKMIQINAPIDHGSSGGGLFNVRGELIGITSSGIEGSTANIGFAVAINEAKVWNHYLQMKFENIPVTDIIKDPVTNPLNYLNKNFSSIPLTYGQAQIEFIDIWEDDGINIYANIDYDNYLKYLEYFDAEKVNQYAQSLGMGLDDMYPNDYVYAGVWFQMYTDTYPDVFPPEEIEYINGKWLVTHNIIYIWLEDKITWEINY